MDSCVAAKLKRIVNFMIISKEFQPSLCFYTSFRHQHTVVWGTNWEKKSKGMFTRNDLSDTIRIFPALF